MQGHSVLPIGYSEGFVVFKMFRIFSVKTDVLYILVVMMLLIESLCLGDVFNIMFVRCYF